MKGSLSCIPFCALFRCAITSNVKKIPVADRSLDARDRCIPTASLTFLQSHSSVMLTRNDQDETVKDKAFTSTLVKSLGTRTRKRTNITSFSWQNSEASDCTLAYEGQTSLYTFIMRYNHLWSQNFRLWVGPWCLKTTASVPSGTLPSLAELSKPTFDCRTWRAVFIAHIFVHSERCPVSQ